MKSGTGGTNESRRNAEAQAVRTDADALGANAHIIYTGDFNLDAGTSEAAWATLTGTGNGKAIDPGSWSSVADEDEYAQGPEYRDSLQLFNSAMQSQNGVQYVAGSYDVFGNNGSTGSNAVNSSSSTALMGLSDRTEILGDLTDIADHLPVVADYDTVGISPLPEPASIGFLVAGGLLLGRRRRRKG